MNMLETHPTGFDIFFLCPAITPAPDEGLAPSTLNPSP